MPKFKRISKTPEGHKFELEEDFTVTPRFDEKYWSENSGYRISVGLGRFGEIVQHPACIASMFEDGDLDERLRKCNTAFSSGFFKVLQVVDGNIKLFKYGRNNGLTCHRDHSWAVNSGAPHAHDILLLEGYRSERDPIVSREIIDRVFLSVLLDHVDTLTGFKKKLYKSFAYAMYWAVRANSIIKG